MTNLILSALVILSVHTKEIQAVDVEQWITCAEAKCNRPKLAAPLPEPSTTNEWNYVPEVVERKGSVWHMVGSEVANVRHERLISYPAFVVTEYVIGYAGGSVETPLFIIRNREESKGIPDRIVGSDHLYGGVEVTIHRLDELGDSI